MIYGNTSIATYKKSNVVVWLLMAFQAGILNIGGFMATQRFVSHITGFATFFAADTVEQKYGHALGMLIVPLFFLLGAMLSAQLVDIRLKLNLKPKYYFSFGIMFLILSSVYLAGHFNFFSPFGQPIDVSNDYALLILLCFACGIQNATITSVSRSVIRTTHLTGLTTDLGIGLVRLINRKKLGDVFTTEDQQANWMRIGIISFFVFGSLIGGLSFKSWGYEGFLLPVLISGGLFILLYTKNKAALKV